MAMLGLDFTITMGGAFLVRSICDLVLPPPLQYPLPWLILLFVTKAGILALASSPVSNEWPIWSLWFLFNLVSTYDAYTLYGLYRGRDKGLLMLYYAIGSTIELGVVGKQRE